MSKDKIIRQGSKAGPELAKSIEEDLGREKKINIKTYPVSVAGVLRKVANLYLPVPDRIAPMEQFAWPVDITKVGIEEVRGLMSYYTAQYSYSLVQIAKVKFVLEKVEYEIRSLTRSIRAEYTAKKKKVVEISGIIEEHEGIQRLENTKLHAQGLIDMITALKEGYDKNVQIASRELSARESEARQSYSKR